MADLIRKADVDEASVRHWRQWFVESGVARLVSTVAPGRSPEQGEKAVVALAGILEAPIENRENWTLPRLSGEAARRGADIALLPQRLSK